jgi:hypothetical protein
LQRRTGVKDKGDSISEPADFALKKLSECEALATMQATLGGCGFGIGLALLAERSFAPLGPVYCDCGEPMACADGVNSGCRSATLRPAVFIFHPFKCKGGEARPGGMVKGEAAEIRRTKVESRIKSEAQAVTGPAL